VEEAEELRRVIPVVEALAPLARVSIDTRKPAVAVAALAAGARIVNDTSGELWEVAAAGGAGWVAMHCPAPPQVMAAHAHYDDVVAQVTADLVARASRAEAAGVPEVWIDPGIGFAKTAAHNLSLLRHLGRLVDTGYRVAVGTSRKSFLGALTPDAAGHPAAVGDRLEGSVATAVWSALQGAAMVRVHDVAVTSMALRLAGLRADGLWADGPT
jgi:dihydropteroate synthase